jgi:hypothetical protein
MVGLKFAIIVAMQFGTVDALPQLGAPGTVAFEKLGFELVIFGPKVKAS